MRSVFKYLENVALSDSQACTREKCSAAREFVRHAQPDLTVRSVHLAVSWPGQVATVSLLQTQGRVPCRRNRVRFLCRRRLLSVYFDSFSLSSSICVSSPARYFLGKIRRCASGDAPNSVSPREKNIYDFSPAQHLII